MLNFRHGIYIIIFSMPLYLLQFSIFGIPTTVLEMMIYILFLAWILDRIQKHYLSFPRRRESITTINSTINTIRNNPILNAGIILLFLGVIISTFNSSDLRTSLGIFKGWFIDPFLFFIVFISVIKKEKHLILVLKSWFASGVAVSLISIFYLINNNLTFDVRLKAFFLSPNHLAMYLSPAFLMLLVLLLSNKKLNIKYLIFLIIILIPLYFTYSYGAFLGVFVAIIWLLYKTAKNNLSFPRRQESITTTNNSLRIMQSIKKILNIKYLIFLIIIFVFIVFISFNKFNQITSSDNRSSSHSRLMIWNASAEIIKDNLLFGIGPGTFQKTYLAYSKKFSEPYLEWAVPQPHNIFLAFYLQAGLIGFIGFILILIWFFSYRRDAINRVSTNDYIVNILMIYILIHGLVDTTYWKNDLSLMFWLLIGIKILQNRALIKKSF